MIYGERPKPVVMNTFNNDSMKEHLQEYAKIVKQVKDVTSYSVFGENTVPGLNRNDTARQMLKKYFVEGSYDPNSFDSPEALQEHVTHMETLFENDINPNPNVELNESTGSTGGQFNAVIGITLPMHKNILMNMVFANGGIPRHVTASPIFTRTMEYLYLVTPDGKKYDLFLDQNKLTDAMNSVNPLTPIELTLPHQGTTNLVNELNGIVGKNKLAVETFVSALMIPDVHYEVGDRLPNAKGLLDGTGAVATTATTVDTWFPVTAKSQTAYGNVNRIFNYPIEIDYKVLNGSDVEKKHLSDVLSGHFLDNESVFLITYKSVVTKAIINAKIDPSDRDIEVPTIDWDTKTDSVQIGNDTGIAARVKIEHIKDSEALFQIDHLSTLMATIKKVLYNRKDDTIKANLDTSFVQLLNRRIGEHRPAMQAVYDMAPTTQYAHDIYEHMKKTFMLYLEEQATRMLQVYNDPNVEISIYGNPVMIQRIIPTEFVTYSTPQKVGSVVLDYSKHVVSSNGKVYNFVGSDKMRQSDELVIVLNPRNSNRIMYVIYDYQLCLTNEIRSLTSGNPQILSFERWLFDEYQPVQSRIKIANPTGYKPGTSETTFFSHYE